MAAGTGGSLTVAEFARLSTPAIACLLALGVIAFWPGYLADPVGLGSGYTHFHALTSALWFALVIVQPLLILRGRRDIHRRLGSISWVLGPLVIIAMFLGAHALQEAFQVGAGRVLPYVFWLQWWLALMFGTFWGLAMFLRRDRFLHARFMAATALTFIDPVIARLVERVAEEAAGQYVSFTIINLVLLALITVDRRAPRGRWVWPVVLLVFLAFELPMLFGFADSATWTALTEAYVKLPLTP